MVAKLQESLEVLIQAIKAITDALPDAGALTTIQADLDNPDQYKADLTTLEARLSAIRAGYLDQLDFNLQEAIAAVQAGLDLTTVAATFSYLNAGGEQTVFTFTPAANSRLNTIWLDLTTLTKNTTIRLKHQIDGANYRTFETFNWTTGMDDGVYFRNVALANARPLQVSLQEVADEGADRAIPYYYAYEVR